jgi:hypothetical protein
MPFAPYEPYCGSSGSSAKQLATNQRETSSGTHDGDAVHHDSEERAVANARGVGPATERKTLRVHCGQDRVNLEQGAHTRTP